MNPRLSWFAVDGIADVIPLSEDHRSIGRWQCLVAPIGPWPFWFLESLATGRDRHRVDLSRDDTDQHAMLDARFSVRPIFKDGQARAILETAYRLRVFPTGEHRHIASPWASRK